MAEPDTKPDTLAVFEAGLKKLVRVPKKSLDRKVKATRRKRPVRKAQ